MKKEHCSQKIKIKSAVPFLQLEGWRGRNKMILRVIDPGYTIQAWQYVVNLGGRR